MHNPLTSLVILAALAVVAGSAGCNGIVGGVPVEVSGGTVSVAADGQTAVLRLSEQKPAPACNTEEPGDVELVIRLASAAAGDFTIGKDASAHFRLTNTTCDESSHDDVAKSGAVHVDRFTKDGSALVSAAGSYDVVFDQGELKGKFNAGGCVVRADQDVDAPDCDDVDGDGEPGGVRHDTGGGGGGGGD